MKDSGMKDKLIFGDLQGEFDSVMRIVDRAPKNVEYISVGDMIDRGPNSKGVMDFFMNEGRAVKGNHEHLMVNEYLQGVFYDSGLWFTNGGYATVNSFMGVEHTAYDQHLKWRLHVPEKYIKWVGSLPHYILEDGLFISHAALNPVLGIDKATELGPGFRWQQQGLSKIDSSNSLLWNRGNPRKNKDFFQVHGHMSHTNVFWYRDKGEDGKAWGVDVDTNFGKKISAVLWPSLEIYSHEWVR